MRRDGQCGAADGVVVGVPVLLPGREHEVAGLQQGVQRGLDDIDVAPYPAIGQAQALHLRAHTKCLEGLRDFMRAYFAQALGRPGDIAGIAGFAIGDRHEVDVEPGLAGGAQQAAAGEGLVIGMRREQHDPASALQQLRGRPFVQCGQPGRRAPRGFALAGAVDARRGYSGHRASASRAATCVPSAAQSRSAWLWRTNTDRSAQRCA